MVALNTKEVDEGHAKILRGKFGSLYDWEKPIVADTVGPYCPEIFDDYERELRTLILECHRVLRNLPDDEVSEISNKSIRFASDPRTKLQGYWNSLLRNEIIALEKAKPHWAAGGFGRPEFLAQFEYWNNFSKLKLHEVVSLTFGVEPKHLESLILEPEDVLEVLARPLVAAKKLAELLKREFKLSSKDSEIDALEFQNWARGVQLEIHPDFASRRSQQEVDILKEGATSKRPDPREIDKISQLFVAMAIDHLGYDPTASRSPVPKEITELAAQMGLEISSDTVRKYLQRGAKFIPSSWQPE